MFRDSILLKKNSKEKKHFQQTLSLSSYRYLQEKTAQVLEHLSTYFTLSSSVAANIPM